MNKKTVLFSLVKECIRQYNTLFQDDWIEQLNWSSEEEAKASFEEGRTKILDFVKSCFVQIGKSLLSGDYIVSRNEFEKAKRFFEKYWSKDHLCLLNGGEDEFATYKERIYLLYELLDANIKALFLGYTRLIVTVDEKLEYNKNNYLFTSQLSG